MRSMEEELLMKQLLGTPARGHPAMCLCDFNNKNPTPYDATGQVRALLSEKEFATRYTSVKLRSFGTKQINKIGDMQKKCIDNMWFTKGLAVHERAVRVILTPSALFKLADRDEPRYMLPTTMNPSDHVPVVAHVVFKA